MGALEGIIRSVRRRIHAPFVIWIVRPESENRLRDYPRVDVSHAIEHHADPAPAGIRAATFERRGRDRELTDHHLETSVAVTSVDGIATGILPPLVNEGRGIGIVVLLLDWALDLAAFDLDRGQVFP